jgi:hypothetical protein
MNKKWPKWSEIPECRQWQVKSKVDPGLNWAPFHQDVWVSGGNFGTRWRWVIICTPLSLYLRTRWIGCSEPVWNRWSRDDLLSLAGNGSRFLGRPARGLTVWRVLPNIVCLSSIPGEIKLYIIQQNHSGRAQKVTLPLCNTKFHYAVPNAHEQKGTCSNTKHTQHKVRADNAY